MTPWQPVDLRTGVMNDAPTPTTTIPLKDRGPERGACVFKWKRVFHLMV